ncbi:MAG: hypothetical protein AAB547_01540 [Patescibacteria group bacterium]
MSEGTKMVLGISGIVVLLLGFVWILQGNDFFLYKVFAPQYEQVRRETFEQSKAYNQGMIQELQNMQFQYVQAGDAHKVALADMILHRAADFDLTQPQVPADLRQFITDLKRDRVMAR